MLLKVLLTITVLVLTFEGYWISTLLLTYPSDLAVAGGIFVVVLTGWITVMLLYHTWRKPCENMFNRFSS